MAESSCNWENLLIYYTNLSPLYLCSSIFTALVLFVTWWFNPRSRMVNVSDSAHEGSPTATQHKQKLVTSLRDSVGTTASSGVWNSDISKAGGRTGGNAKTDHGTMKHIKSVRHAAIERELTAGLSTEQLAKEQETQATQLEAIYKLLKEKEDQFQIRSMDELQEQLRLYKT